MDARRPSRNRRRPRRPVTTTLLLALALVAGTLVASTAADAAARSASLASGGTISIRSGDGCTVKAAPPSNGRKYVRNFVCRFAGVVKAPPAQPAAPRIQTLVNGDTMAVTSADGCALKLVPKNNKYVKNVACWRDRRLRPRR